MLIIFGGLPGVGKTLIARELARQIGALYLRIDSIEQALRDSRCVTQLLEDSGYRVGYALAEDNLRLGRTVVADSVNPLAITRDAWVDVANRTGVCFVEIEVLCSDAGEHRRRVEERASDIRGLPLPGWAEVVSREYDAWGRERIVVDTANLSVQQNVATIREILEHRRA
jgi:predicted kinase